MSDGASVEEGNALLLSVQDGVLVLTLNRQHRRNAIDTALRERLIDALERLERDPSLRVAVLTGAGETFCSGMDLAEFAAGRPKMSDRPNFFRFPRTKPVIAAVNGLAVAGGMELVLACDLAVASTDALFGMPEAQRGLAPGGGALFRLPRLVGQRQALQLLLTGDRFDATRALELGLVNEVVAPGELLSASMRVAHAVASAAPLATAAIMRLVRSATAPTEEDLWVLTEGDVRAVNASADAKEGARAFVEKRPAVWTGR